MAQITKPIIAGISDLTKSQIKQKTVHSLPDNPASMQIKADTIKKAMYEFVLGDTTSLCTEINRIKTALTNYIDELADKYNNHDSDTDNPHEVKGNQIETNETDSTKTLLYGKSVLESLQGLNDSLQSLTNIVSTNNTTLLNAKQNKEITWLNKNKTIEEVLTSLNQAIAVLSSNTGSIEAALTSYATTSAIDSAISTAKSEIIGGAGDNYDTLKEIQSLLTDSTNGLQALLTLIETKANANDVYFKTEPQGKFVDDALKGSVNLLDQSIFSRLSFQNSGNDACSPLIDMFNSGSFDVPIMSMYCPILGLGGNGIYNNSFTLENATNCRIRIGLNGNVVDDKVMVDNYFLEAGTYYLTVKVSNFSFINGVGKCDLSDLQISKYDVPYQPYNPTKQLATNEIDKTINLFNISILNGLSIPNLSCDNDIIIVSDYGVDCGYTLKDFCPTLKVGDRVKFTFETTGTNSVWLNVPNYYLEQPNLYTITQDMLDSNLYFYNDASGSTNACTIKNIQLSKYDTDYKQYGGGEIVHQKEMIDNTYGSGTALTSNTNCNSLAKAGIYTTSTNSIIASMTNLPSGITGGELRLEVKYINSSYFFQELYTNTTEVSKWIRYNSNGTWTAWKRINVDTNIFDEATISQGNTYTSPTVYGKGLYAMTLTVILSLMGEDVYYSQQFTFDIGAEELSRYTTIKREFTDIYLTVMYDARFSKGDDGTYFAASAEDSETGNLLPIDVRIRKLIAY